MEDLNHVPVTSYQYLLAKSCLRKKSRAALKDDEQSNSISWYLFYFVYDEDVSQQA